MTMITDKIRYELLKLLDESPKITQRELALKLNISLGKTNYCLKALLEKGWVKIENFKRSKSRINYMYILTPNGLEEKARVTLAFLKHKQEEYIALMDELEVLRKEAVNLGVNPDQNA